MQNNIGEIVVFSQTKSPLIFLGNPNGEQTLRSVDHDWFATPFVMMTCQVKILAEQREQ